MLELCEHNEITNAFTEMLGKSTTPLLPSHDLIAAVPATDAAAVQRKTFSAQRLTKHR